MKFLEQFKGKPGGLFETFKKLHNDLRLAWYPSAGFDYRPIILLNHKENDSEPAAPELFVYTDFQPPLEIAGNEILYQDRKTTIRVLEREELQRLSLPLWRQFISLSPNALFNRVFFLRLSLESTQYGAMEACLLYVGAINEVFCLRYLLPDTVVSHIIHVRYGSSFGGARTTGSWILNILKKLNTTYFISSMSLTFNGFDIGLIIENQMLAREPVLPRLVSIRTTPGISWSCHGDVHWNLVEWDEPSEVGRVEYESEFDSNGLRQHYIKRDRRF